MQLISWRKELRGSLAFFHAAKEYKNGDEEDNEDVKEDVLV